MSRKHRRTAKKLNRVYHGSKLLPFDIDKDRIIIFSDLHMADRSPGIDDFLRNEMIYCHALQQYYEQGWRLVLNGDVEEGWEARPKAIRDAYRETAYAQEKRFAEKGPLWHTRIVGNHDNLWNRRSRVARYLWPLLGPITVHRGVRIGRDIFITHGHQGDVFSDTASMVSRFAVRHGWRWLQRGLKVSTARAATNHMIRRNRDEALYRWAHDHGKLLIAGHTHRGMFGEVPDANDLVTVLRKLEEELPSSPTPFQVRAAIEYLRKTLQSSPLTGDASAPLPCYFNGGSCVYTDGITGIELAGGQIRLVHWGMENGFEKEGIVPVENPARLLRIERRVLRETHLQGTLDQIREHHQKHLSEKSGVSSKKTDREKSIGAAA